MPFDPTPLTRPAVSRNGVELDKLRRLVTALRAPMPDRYVWNFYILHSRSACGTIGCALGLARNLEILEKEKFGRGREFGLQPHERKRVFVDFDTYGKLYSYEVTPSMVADALDTIIAREEADTAAEVS